MAFPSRKETYDSNTPSSRTSVNGALYRGSPKGATNRSDQVSISNSSVHTTSTATTSEDLFNYTEQDSGGVPSTSLRKSFHSLEKPTFRFRNQSLSTVGTVREAGSVRSSTATPSSTQEIRLSNIPSFEDEDNSPNDLFLKASDPDEARAREARVLESKVARVALRNFSVEEVTALRKEVDHWLSEATAADASTALALSSLLLKTILANHFVFSDASKAAKNAEMSLKLKVDELELEKRRLEVELRMQKAQYNQKVQECESLHTEPPGSFVTTPPASSTSQSSAFPPSSPVESPTSFTSKIASRLGFTRSPSVNSPRMSTLGNAGIGAGGGPPSPAGSSVASDIAYPFLFRAKALNAYTASPDDPNEMSFSKDEILNIIDNNGILWWQARKEDGEYGIVPSNYLYFI